MKKIKKIKVKLRFTNSKKNRMQIVYDKSAFDQELDLEVIGYDTNYNSYLIKVPDNVSGYTISEFHVLHYEVPSKFLGHRFNNYHAERILH